MMERERFSTIEDALFEAASGNGQPRPSRRVQRKVGVNSDGESVMSEQVYESDRPNIQLALKLLDQRIGGPQDYC